MNIITDKLPTYITIKNKKYAIKSDFKEWLKFYEILNSNQPQLKKMALAISLIYEERPPDFKTAMEGLISFFNPESEAVAKKGKNHETGKPIFDFCEDSELIYAAFLQQYNIDLSRTNMHWWRFKALFNSLTEDTKFVKIVQIRGIKLSEIKNSEQKKYYKKMQNLFELSDKRTSEQKENDFVNSFIDKFI